MLGYLAAETAFVRAFGNRSLLLVFLCALSRTGNKMGSASALGLSLDVNPGVIVVFGPLLALFLLLALKVEADGLLLGRETVLAEASALPARARRGGRLAYVLFLAPALAATFLVWTYLAEVVPLTEGCGYDRWRQLYDLRWAAGTPTLYCLHDIKDGMPWIYPPFQVYGYVVCLALCFRVTWSVARDWSKARG